MSDDVNNGAVSSDAPQETTDVDTGSSPEDVETGSSPEEEQPSSPSIPYERFKEVNETMKTYKSEIDELKSTISELSSLYQKEGEPAKEETIPDFYEDPKEFASFIKKQAMEEIRAEQDKKAQESEAMDKYIQTQLSAIKEKDPEFDTDVIADFAEKYHITDKETGYYNLVAAHELMQAYNMKSQENKMVKQAKEVPIPKSKTTKATNQGLTRGMMKKMSLDQVVDFAKNVVKSNT